MKFSINVVVALLIATNLAFGGDLLTQTLNFQPIPNQVYGAEPVALEATSSAPLTPRFEILSGPGRLMGGSVVLTGAGLITVRAYQSGSMRYLPAPDARRSFTVARAPQTITFSEPPSQPYGAKPLRLSATASSKLPVTLSITGGPGVLADNILTFTRPGTVSIRARQLGSGNYLPASEVIVKVVMEHLPQSISFATVPDSPYTFHPIPLSATSTSGLRVKFSVISGPATISNRALTYTGIGTVVVEANQEGNSTYAPAVVVRQSILVGKADQTIAFPELADRPAGSKPFRLEATTSSGLPIRYTVRGNAQVSGNLLTLTGSGRVIVEAHQSGNVNFTPAVEVERSFISTISQTITFPALPHIAYTVSPQGLHATSSAGGRVTYRVVSGPAEVDGSRFFLTGRGEVVIEANAAAYGSASAANPARRSFSVLAKEQTITFPAIGQQTMGNAPVSLEATASSGLPVSYSLTGPGKISGSTLTFTAPGLVQITASQGGNGIYGAAPIVKRNVRVLDDDVKLPAIFGDHMVLQQHQTLPIWGTAKPGQVVTVTLGTRIGKATADANGNWRVDLQAIPANGRSLTLVVSGVGTRVINDVLAGDVWLCAGQSNMAFPLAESEGAEYEVPEANRDQVRMFIVENKASIRTQADVTGTWKICTPESAAAFSAVGYYFGARINAERNYPVGLIGSYWDGTPAEAWCGLTGLRSDPALQDFVDEYTEMLDEYPTASANYPAVLDAYNEELTEWNATEGVEYTAAVRAWVAAVQKAQANGETPPIRPMPDPPTPRPPLNPEGDQYTPTAIYHGMIAPLIPFALKGVIWYQGEANVGDAQDYEPLFRGLITDWRKQWGQGDFPFLYVQVSTFATENNKLWPFLRESQLKALALPNTGMAVSVDIGDPEYLHPPDKYDVADRLLLVAKHVAYGENLVCSGPLYDSMQIEDSKVRLDFTSVGSGLSISNSPWHPANESALSTNNLIGFTIAGADKKWYEAQAVIQGDQVVVSSPSVPNPIAVRYEWDNAPRGNLYNKEGLPASPFRTDSMPITASDH